MFGTGQESSTRNRSSAHEYLATDMHFAMTGISKVRDSPARNCVCTVTELNQAHLRLTASSSAQIWQRQNDLPHKAARRFHSGHCTFSYVELRWGFVRLDRFTIREVR